MGDAALEQRLGSELLVQVDRVVVAGYFRKPYDIVFADRAFVGSALAYFQFVDACHFQYFQLEIISYRRLRTAPFAP